MTTRPKRKRKGTGPTGEGAGEAAAPPAGAGSAVPTPAPAAEAVPASDAMPSAAESGTAEPVGLAPVSAPTSPGGGGGEAVGPEELRQDEAVVDRVEHLARDVAWVLITAGVVGIIMPGVLGTPFLIAGAAALWPGNRKRFQHWREGHSPKFFHGSMKQINRFLDDLERRYPKNGRR